MKTLAELPPPTGNQEVLNRAYQYFIVEGHPRAVDNKGKCVYRTPDGNGGCAIGCQLPDELYVTSLESQSINTIYFASFLKTEAFLNIQEYFNKCDHDFLNNLQQWHDMFELDFAQLRAIATKFNLTLPTTNNTK